MAELPVEPMLARSLLVSGKMGCSVEMIVIASCLSVKRHPPFPPLYPNAFCHHPAAPLVCPVCAGLSAANIK